MFQGCLIRLAKPLTLIMRNYSQVINNLRDSQEKGNYNRCRFEAKCC